MRGTTMSPANCACPRSFSAASRREPTGRPHPARRRLGDVAHRWAPRPARRPPRRCRVARAAAEVAVEAALDLVGARQLARLQERGHRQQHPGRAEAALEGGVARERVLEAANSSARRDPRPSGRRGPPRPRRGSSRRTRAAVDEHRARAAHLHLAGALGAGQPEPVAEKVEQQLLRLDLADGAAR